MPPVEGGADSGRLNAVGDARHANDLTAKPDEDSPIPNSWFLRLLVDLLCRCCRVR